MRLSAVAGAALVLGGCGAQPAPSPFAGWAPPPPIVLGSLAGDQQSALQHWCVHRTPTYEVCGTTHLDRFFGRSEQVSVVRPGEVVHFSIPGAASIRLAVRRYGCDRGPVRRIRLEADGRWRVGLAPGRYSVRAVVPSVRVTGGSADTDAAFGVWVDPGRKPTLIAATDAPEAAC